MKPSDNAYFVARSHHDTSDCNRWCVWKPDRTFLAACDSKADADQIAQALNASLIPKQAQMELENEPSLC